MSTCLGCNLAGEPCLLGYCAGCLAEKPLCGDLRAVRSQPGNSTAVTLLGAPAPVSGPATGGDHRMPWEATVRDGESGWAFHDWADYQPSSEEIEREREQARDRQRVRRENLRKARANGHYSPA